MKKLRIDGELLYLLFLLFLGLICFIMGLVKQLALLKLALAYLAGC